VHETVLIRFAKPASFIKNRLTEKASFTNPLRAQAQASLEHHPDVGGRENPLAGKYFVLSLTM
jgi:hypothetical protein